MHQQEDLVNTLKAMIWALILQRILSIPTGTLLIIFLKYSRELREFCGFNKVPDASKFKQDFLLDLQSMFDNLVDITEPICQQIDEFKASMTIFDTSGIEAYVPCTNSSLGRMFYVYPEKDLHAYPGILRGTSEWEETYKIRSVAEQSINHFKESSCIAGRKTQN